MDLISMQPVAYVHSPRREASDDNWGSVVSEITLTESFTEDALLGTETFSHLEILFVFDKVPDEKVCKTSRHPRGNPEWPVTGIFAQRAKDRPNKIGLCTVELISRTGKTLLVRGLDAIDGTPVLDIKPVFREFLPRTEIRQPEWVSELMKNYWTES